MIQLVHPNAQGLVGRRVLMRNMSVHDVKEGRMMASGAWEGSLTRVTVYLVGSASAALDSAAELTGDTKTDTINRALQVYDHVVRCQAQGERVVWVRPEARMRRHRRGLRRRLGWLSRAYRSPGPGTVPVGRSRRGYGSV